MTATPLLGIQQVSPTQTGKETTINDGFLALEQAGNATLAVSFAGGDVTLSANQFTRNMVFSLSGQLIARVLNIPAQINGVNTSRVFVVRNSGSYGITVQITGGAGTAVVVNANETRLLDVDGSGNIHVAAQPSSAFAVFTDATAARTLAASDRDAYVRMTNAAANTVTIPKNADVNIPIGTRIWIEQAGAGRTTIVPASGVTVRQPSTQAQLYLRSQYSQVWATKIATDEWVLGGDFGGLLNYVVGAFAVSSILTNEILLDHPAVSAFTFPANFAGSQASVGTNPAASFIMTVLKNGATVGTITISTAGVTGFATTGGSSISVAVGDVITVQAPATPDAAIARLRFSLKGFN